MNRKTLLSAAVVAAVLGISAANAARAEEIWVKNETVIVRAGKGSIYDVVAEVKKGDKMTVVSHDGKWILVTVNGKQGYIPQSLIAANEVKADFKPFTANTGTVTEGAADRPLEPNAVKYATGKGLSPVAMHWLEKFRDSLQTHPKDWETFMQQGQVGSYGPNR
jgi:uncharacterized protein YgiM (DUF1202 family)